MAEMLEIFQKIYTFYRANKYSQFQIMLCFSVDNVVLSIITWSFKRLSVDSIWYRSSKYFSLLISSAGPHFGVGFNSFFILYKDIYMYSHTCIKRSPLRQIKVAIEDRWPLKRGSIHMKCCIRGQERGDLLISMTAR